MTWALIGFALLNAGVAQAFWPYWLRQNEDACTARHSLTAGVMCLACFAGSIGIAFYAGLMVPR